ncbi:MAG: hypothetical protein V3V20_05300 [Algisphaera sp.]
MTQQKKRDRRAKKKRWQQRGGAGMVRDRGPVRDPSNRVTGPLAMGAGLTILLVVAAAIIITAVGFLSN